MLPFDQPSHPRTSAHPASIEEEVLLAQCEFTSGRTSGPGGQHRNKVETHVSLLHRPTGVAGQAGERRSQTENKRVAVRRLRLALAVEHREPLPRGEVRTALWLSRTRGQRISCNPDHHDYPSLLAEALDVIADADWDLKAPALRLDVTASQLLRLIKDHPPAFVRLNAERQSRGLRPLK